MKSFPAGFAFLALLLCIATARAENYIYRGSTRIMQWDAGGYRVQPRYMIVGDFVRVSDEVFTATVSWVEFGGQLGARKLSYILPLEVRCFRATEGHGVALVFPERRTTPSEEVTTLMTLHGVTTAGLAMPARLEGGYNSYSEAPGATNPSLSRTLDSLHLDRGLTTASNLAQESQAEAWDRVWNRFLAAGFTHDF